MSRDFKQIEREIAQAARWAVKRRMLQNEALEVAGAMREQKPGGTCCLLRRLIGSSPSGPRSAASDWPGMQVT